METRNELLRFLAVHKIPLQDALEILQQEAERIRKFKEKYKKAVEYEKQVLAGYEKR